MLAHQFRRFQNGSIWVASYGLQGTYMAYLHIEPPSMRTIAAIISSSGSRRNAVIHRYARPNGSIETD
jgi:hypothetical protein